jgi:hypothetical protein
MTEIKDVADKGVFVTHENLKISDRASLLMPWHRKLDELEEQRLADKKYGSTKQGIAPFYSDKYQKKTVMAGELFYPEVLKAHLKDLMEWKNLILTGVYGAEPYTWEEIEAWLNTSCEAIKPFICDTGAFLRKANEDGKRILFEAQLGSLRDLDHGIYPMTTSSNTIAAYAPVGAGLPGAKIDRVVGVKDTSGTFPAFIKLLNYFRDKDFQVLQGSTNLAVPSMLMGADGYVPSLAPLFPKAHIAVYDYGRARDIDNAMKWGAIVDEICKIYPMAKSQTASTKYAMSTLGFVDKRVIRPTEPITAEEMARIDAFIDKMRDYM